MPRYTLSTVIQKAIDRALLDRESLLDAYGGDNDDVRDEIAAIESIRNVQYDKMTKEQKVAAFRALVYAEQYEDSYADSIGNKKDKWYKDASRAAKLFREYRHRYIGKSQFETEIEKATETLVVTGRGLVLERTGELVPDSAFKQLR